MKLTGSNDFSRISQISRIFRGLVFHLILSQLTIYGQSQTSNEYTFGVNSLGSYGFEYSHLNANTKLSFSYSTLNNISHFSSNASIFKSYFSNQMSTLGLSYTRFKPVGRSFIFYYGGKIDLASNPFKNQNLSVETNANYLHQIDLHLGLQYKINENLSIGAEFRQGYGNFIYNPTSIFNNTFQNNWLTY